MMFFYIGFLIDQKGGDNAVYIVTGCIYGVLILLNWGRMVYLYHKGELD